MTDVEIHQRLELLLGLGLGFLESGQSTGQTSRTLAACAEALGLPDAQLDILGSRVTVEHISADGAVSHARGRASSIDVIDSARLRELSRVVLEIERGEADPERTTARIERIRASRTPWWWSIAGLVMLAFFISLQVGTGWDAWLTAAGVQLVSATAAALAGRFGMPRLFAATLQTVLSGLVAILLADAGLVQPAGAAAALAVAWLLILPLPQLIEAITDAVEGEYVAALTRIANVGITAGGIVIGASVVLYVGGALDLAHSGALELPDMPWYLGLVFAALGAIGNAIANGGRASLILPAAMLGVVTSASSQLLHLTDLHPGWANSIAAVLLGFVAVFLAGWIKYPYQVLALMGITGALLPGITVFRGILREMSGSSGVEFFAQAGTTCVGLGVGVAFGVYFAVLTSAKRVRAQVAPPVRRR